MNITIKFWRRSTALLLSRVVRWFWRGDNTYKAKMRALLEGLEIQCIDKLLNEGTVEDYKLLGKSYVIAVQNKIESAINSVINNKSER